MITIPTVLILGAGASCPYGFPTAEKLKNRIREAFSNPDTAGGRLLGDNCGFTRQPFFEFREAFRKSGVSSVDAFLERRPEFLEVGKLAIAYCLIPFENETNLYPPFVQGEDWYAYLSEKLNASFDEFGNNTLSIITFNYDRSLEHYLFNSLVNLHGKSVKECLTKFTEIPIIHVYGQLGTIPYPQDGCREYLPLDGETREMLDAVRDAAAGITLLHEEASDLRQARELLDAADRICFLGFSYHPLNLARLQLENSKLHRRVFGTVLRLEKGEVDQTALRLSQTLLCGKVTLDDADSLTVLRRHLILG